MDQTDYHVCSVCGEVTSTPEHWFLVFQNQPNGRLAILKWTHRLASAEGMQMACCATHVSELVVHWMATGNIDHPFAHPSSWNGPRRRWSDHRAPWQEIDLRDAVLLGELMIDRESIRRVLTQNPHALKSLLDTLQESLHAEVQHNLVTAQCSSALVI